MNKLNKKKEFFYFLTTLMLFSPIHATSMLNDQETEFTSEHVNSLEKYSALKNEIEKTDYNPPLSQSEKDVVNSLLSYTQINDHSDEEKKLIVKEYAKNLQKYPAEGTWIIRKEGKPVGYVSLEYNPHDFDPLPNYTTLGYTEIIEREKKNGVGAKALECIYKQVLPYINKEMKFGKIGFWDNKLTNSTIEFSGVEAEIVPHDNFASMISQVRSGASVSAYGDEVLSFFYPPLEAHTLVPYYPRIEELRNIISELENSETRLKAKEKFYEFFNSLK